MTFARASPNADTDRLLYDAINPGVEKRGRVQQINSVRRPQSITSSQLALVTIVAASERLTSRANRKTRGCRDTSDESFLAAYTQRANTPEYLLKEDRSCDAERLDIFTKISNLLRSKTITRTE